MYSSFLKMSFLSFSQRFCAGNNLLIKSKVPECHNTLRRKYWSILSSWNSLSRSSSLIWHLPHQFPGTSPGSFPTHWGAPSQNSCPSFPITADIPQASALGSLVILHTFPAGANPFSGLYPVSWPPLPCRPLISGSRLTHCLSPMFTGPLPVEALKASHSQWIQL